MTGVKLTDLDEDTGVPVNPDWIDGARLNHSNNVQQVALNIASMALL